MTRILAIDPGSEQSGWVIMDTDDGQLVDFGKSDNETLLSVVRSLFPNRIMGLVIEQIQPRYGLQMGWATLDTMRWVGRFEEAARPVPVSRLVRSEILRHLGVVTAPRKGEKRVSADSGVRQALIDRYGGTGGKAAAIGLKASPGPLYGVSKDAWAALAVACTWADQHEARP